MTELADVFHHHGPSYRAQFGDKMLPSHRQAMHAIEHCRTPALGGHIYTCDACGETLYLYHSCRNRHCPKCQNDKAYRWLEKQHDMLLPGHDSPPCVDNWMLSLLTHRLSGGQTIKTTRALTHLPNRSSSVPFAGRPCAVDRPFHPTKTSLPEQWACSRLDSLSPRTQ